MKRKLIVTAVLLVGTMAVTLPTRADSKFAFGIGIRSGRGYFHVGFDRVRHRSKHFRHDRRVKHAARPFVRHRHAAAHACVRVPVYRQVWVAPVYRRVFVGYDSCGQRVYRSVAVRHGYFRRVLSHHACGQCGVIF